MAPHSSTLAWKSHGQEPGSLQSMGSLRIGHPGTWRCGQAASRVGSSSSGSNSAPVGFDEGGSVRKRFTEN